MPSAPDFRQVALEQQWMRTLHGDLKKLRSKFSENVLQSGTSTTRWELHYSHGAQLEEHIHKMEIQLNEELARQGGKKQDKQRDLELLETLKPLLEKATSAATEHKRRIAKFDKIEVRDRKKRRVKLLRELDRKKEDVSNMQMRINSEKTVLHTTAAAMTQIRDNADTVDDEEPER